MCDMKSILACSSRHHDHLCPRQVLGVRIGLAGAAALGLEVPRRDKRLVVILETDGCFSDGIAAATGCTVGHRTMRIEDYGKIAATLIDVETEQALRLAPRLDVRERALDGLPVDLGRYAAQLQAYQMMPDDQLLTVQSVHLTQSVKQILSQPGKRVICEGCGEEIINEKEMVVRGRVLCRSCVGEGYYLAATAGKFILSGTYDPKSRHLAGPLGVSVPG